MTGCPLWRLGSLLHCIEEVLAGAGGDELHVLVADVMKSFGTVDRSFLDCSLSRLGLPAWFRKVFIFPIIIRFGKPWCRDGSIPQGCLLSIVFIVALCVPWCRRLEVLPGIKSQLYADP